MTFAGINLVAVLAAAVASWLAGAVWYTLLARPWMIALGKTKAELMRPDGKPSPAPFVVAFLAECLMAAVLASFLARAGAAALPAAGLVTAALAWIGFVATTLATNHGFGGQSPMLTVIDGGHWLVVLLLQGAILSLIDP